MYVCVLYIYPIAYCAIFQHPPYGAVESARYYAAFQHSTHLENRNDLEADAVGYVRSIRQKAKKAYKNKSYVGSAPLNSQDGRDGS